MADAVTDPLPQPINSRVRIKSADMVSFTYLCGYGFHPEIIEIGKWITMRRDFHDSTICDYGIEPPSPRSPL